MTREPVLPGDADETAYRAYLIEHAAWTKEKGRAHLRAVRPNEGQPADAVPLEPEPVTPEWDTNWLPEPVAAWVNAVHTAYAVPKVMAIAAAMCTAASLVQGKVSVRIKPGWEEPLSLFWLVFSPTASMKSAVLSLATKPLYQLQDAIAADNAPALVASKRRKSLLEGRLKKIYGKYATKGAISEEDRNDLVDGERELDQLVIPTSPRWLYDDVNPALVLTKMRRNLESTEKLARMAVLDAEGTFMSNLLGRHSGHIDVSALLKGYMGEPVNRTRASRAGDDEVDTVLPATYLTMCLMVQPHILDQIRGVAELSDNGLLGRCIVTELGSKASLPRWDAPPVPEAVQTEYARWLVNLNALPAGTVVDLSHHSRPGGILERFYHTVGEDLGKEQGAAAWSKRSPGRICRLVALSELGSLSELSDRQTGGASARALRGEVKISYLVPLLYSRALSSAQAREPHSDPLAALTHRTLRWLRQSTVLTVGSQITLRALIRGLTIKKEAALTVADALVESGHLEQLAPTVRGNRTLTVSYRILSLDPLGSRVRPDQPAPEPEPDYGPDPGGPVDFVGEIDYSEYMGNDT